MATLESLKTATFNHYRHIEGMSGEEVLKELLFLKAGYADEQSPKGVKVGLDSELKARLLDLEKHIIESVDSKCAVAA